jgi:exodeoxyribonuclease-3
MKNISFNERQKFLDETIHEKQMGPHTKIIRFLNWNIRNPSLKRAQKQIEWIERNNFDIIVLTEAKFSQGCIYIRDRLKSLGYTTEFTKPENDDYGVIVAVNNLKEIVRNSIKFLPYRTSSLACSFYGKSILIIGTYFPVWRNKEKKKFLEEFEKFIANENIKNKFENWIIIGDLNILEPNHDPQYSQYKPWEYFYNKLIECGFVDAFRFFHHEEKEYSWFGREGNGYRFDHIFASKNILSLLSKCFYVHEPRLEKLSDHSAMYLEIKI